MWAIWSSSGCQIGRFYSYGITHYAGTLNAQLNSDYTLHFFSVLSCCPLWITYNCVCFACTWMAFSMNKYLSNKVFHFYKIVIVYCSIIDPTFVALNQSTNHCGAHFPSTRYGQLWAHAVFTLHPTACVTTSVYQHHISTLLDFQGSVAPRKPRRVTALHQLYDKCNRLCWKWMLSFTPNMN